MRPSISHSLFVSSPPPRIQCEHQQQRKRCERHHGYRNIAKLYKVPVRTGDDTRTGYTARQSRNRKHLSPVVIRGKECARNRKREYKGYRILFFVEQNRQNYRLRIEEHPLPPAEYAWRKANNIRVDQTPHDRCQCHREHELHRMHGNPTKYLVLVRAASERYSEHHDRDLLGDHRKTREKGQI